MEMPGLRPRGGAAGAAPFAHMPNAPQMRRVRAADQGPLDWLVPFIPPVLRVNRETREAIRHNVAAMLSMEALATALRKAALATKLHWRSAMFYIVFVTVWVCGLVWIHHNETEFSVAMRSAIANLVTRTFRIQKGTLGIALLKITVRVATYMTQMIRTCCTSYASILDVFLGLTATDDLLA
ncbi:hypothetical protein BBJ28_00012317 [Nothophytophthora sp. Chile5]|nr:hypothetical protein BBJ28_00012317 [Nothophytophthora sp. Chile5]